MTFTLLTDADLEPVDEARLAAAINAVTLMTFEEFFAACKATGRPVQAHRDVLTNWNRNWDRT